jgi:glycine cleavage system H protein
MSAGLVSYKLCDRNFDCDRCPFDAAIRGEALSSRGCFDMSGARVAALYFPDDRLYSAGHTWVQERGGALVRVGLDAFAVALLGFVRRIRPGISPSSSPGSSSDRNGDLADGSVLCELDVGVGRLPVTAPVGGRVRAWNRTLEDDGAPLVSSPYEEGWIAEMDLTVPGALTDLLPAVAALESSRLDLRRFRRRAALFLFEEAETPGDLGPTLPDGGEILTDLRYILGARRYLELAGDLVR